MRPRPDRAETVAHPTLTAAMVAWRAAHPHATFADIEIEATHQGATLRTGLIAAALAAGDPLAAPTCETCGRIMVRNGMRERTIITSQAEPVTVTAPRYRCSACGVELSPPR